MLLNKQEIAIRETNQAIKMFFKNEDPISNLLVACAANEILSTLLKKKNIPVLAGKNNLIVKIFFKEKVNEYKIQRNKYYNFFKHADKDSTKEIEFNTNSIWYFILENIIFIKKLNIKFSKEMAFFLFWILLYKRNLFIKNEKLDLLIKQMDLKEEDFFENYDHYITKIVPEHIEKLVKC